MQDSKRAQFLWVGDPIGDVFAGGPPKPGVMVTMTSSPDLKTAVSDVQTADFAGIVIHLQAAVGPPDLDAARQLKSCAGETPFIVVAREEVGPTDVALAQAVGAADLVTRSLWPHLWKNKLALYIDLHQARSRLQPAAQPAAAALRESNERFELLLNSSGDGIYGMSADTTCTFLNKAGAEMLGYLPQELVGRPIHDVIHHHRPDGSHYPQTECKIGIASRARRAVRVDDEVFWRKDGTAVPVSYSVNPMIVGGRNAGAVITFSDITERRRVEDALRISNERVKLATDAGGLGLFTWEMVSDTVSWHNDRPYEIFGLSKDDPPIDAKRFLAEFVHPEDAAGFAQAVTATLEDSKPFYFLGRIFRSPDRDVRWVEFSGQLQATGATAVRVVGTAGDVTQRKQAEFALKESEERLRQLANTIPNLAWMANSDGYITWYNDRWYDYTGTTPAEMEGWGWQTVHDAKTLPAVLESWTASITTGQTFEMTFPLRGADGEFRPFFTRVAPLRNSQGNIVQWFGTNTDVSSLKKAEDELRQADRRKDEFLAMLAHELRNPLAPIRNAAELLRRQNSTDPRVRSAHEIIARQVSHMTGLLNDLLDVSRVTRGMIELERERIDLVSVIHNAVEQVGPLISAKEHVLSIDVGTEQAYVFASRLRLTQVLSNLLDNAAKYSPPRSRIGVTVERLGNKVAIRVHDSGIGISAELLPRIFEPFSQAERGSDRSQGGLGLGLAVVRGLVGLHGGSITASSPGLGLGSAFDVLLPVSDATEPPLMPAPVPAALADLPCEPMHILVVDDNVDAAQTLELLLQAAGHTTRTAFTAADAITLVRQETFDRAILDIGLPDMTGHELAIRIRTLLEHPPTLLALSGYGQSIDKATSLASGFAMHLVKPIEPEALLQALSSAPSDRGPT